MSSSSNDLELDLKSMKTQLYAMEELIKIRDNSDIIDRNIETETSADLKNLQNEVQINYKTYDEFKFWCSLVLVVCFSVIYMVSVS